MKLAKYLSIAFGVLVLVSILVVFVIVPALAQTNGPGSGSCGGSGSGLYGGAGCGGWGQSRANSLPTGNLVPSGDNKIW